MKTVAVNKRAKFDYLILDQIEAGIVLTGDEIKSLRLGSVSLAESYATIHGGNIQLLNCHIGQYTHAYTKKSDTRRSRRLLMHRKEITRLVSEISRKGLTLIPLKIYFNKRGFAKVLIGLAKHKKSGDKKKVIREREIKREAEREMKVRVK